MFSNTILLRPVPNCHPDYNAMFSEKSKKCFRNLLPSLVHLEFTYALTSNIFSSTTDSSLSSDFYNAALRVYVRSAPETLVVFLSTDWHKMTLLNIEPRDAEKIII
jgi:hypothetical protein